MAIATDRYEVLQTIKALFIKGREGGNSTVQAIAVETNYSSKFIRLLMSHMP